MNGIDRGTGVTVYGVEDKAIKPGSTDLTANHLVSGGQGDRGRLDIDTTGLVLLTDDGQWSHRITSPRHHCEKTYHVTLESPVSSEITEKFAQGIELRGDKEQTRPAVMEIITPTEVLLTISEGRYHQVKRMFAAMGNHVVALHRRQIGEIVLDESLEPGEYRELSREEIDSVGVPPELQQKTARRK